MTESDRNAMRRLAGEKNASRGATTDDLQGLLLQIVFALLMVFMIAYFMFVSAEKKAQAEQVLDLNRQKLVLALEKTAEDHRIRYGLNALMTQGTDARRVFDADSHVKDGRLALAPAAKAAFAAGSAAAARDYADPVALGGQWRDEVLSAASLAAETLTEAESAWLDGEIADRLETVRLETRGMQRALAARLELALIARPETLGEVTDPGALADLIKAKALDLIRAEIGSEVLP